MEDSLEDYMDEETSRLLERYTQESASGNLGFYDVDEYVALIDAYIWNGDLTKAMGVLSLAKGQYPEAVELKLKHAEICLEMDFLDQSLQLLAEVERVEPYLYDSYIVKGHTLLCMNRLDEARESFLTAGEKGAEKVDVDMGLAQVEIEAGNHEKAWEHMRRIIGYENDTVETCNRFIDLAQKGGKLPEAMELLRRLLKENPYSLLYWKTLVELADAAACYEQALEACDYALAIAPDDLETLKNKFNLFENVDTEESRLDFYLQMEKIAVDNGDETFLAAVMLRVAQEYELDFAWEKAEVYYHRLLDVPAVRQYALFRLGVIADFAHSYASSLAYFKQALELVSEDGNEKGNRAKIYRAMARTYLNMGKEEEGLKYSLMAVQEDPDDRFHLYNYIADALERGGFADAEEYLEKAFAEKITAERMLAKAVFYYYTGRQEDSYGLFTLAFLSDTRTLRDLSLVFPELVADDRHIKALFESSAETLKDTSFNIDDEEPQFYYGPETNE
ncbi:MAG: hypothetical protein NC396_02200 [Bacteroides sp.]|nr:hypothetical protein [Bacteroides sp.]MCM1085001.1 hypothetical protein [Bacteroides sp.]